METRINGGQSVSVNVEPETTAVGSGHEVGRNELAEQTENPSVERAHAGIVELPPSEMSRPDGAGLDALIAALTGDDLDMLVGKIIDSMARERAQARRLRHDEQNAQLAAMDDEVRAMREAAEHRFSAALWQAGAEGAEGVGAVAGGFTSSKASAEAWAGGGNAVGAGLNAGGAFETKAAAIQDANAAAARRDAKAHENLASDAGESAGNLRETMNRVLDHLQRYQQTVASTNSTIARG